MTDFVDQDEPGVEILQISHDTEKTQVQRLKQLKTARDAKCHQAALDRLKSDAKTGVNLMPALIDAAEADATVGEMMHTMQTVFGSYDGGPEW